MSVEIYTDGSSFGNPGPSGAGAALYARDIDGDPVLVYEHSRALGHTTNNVAEYSAIADALSIAIEMGFKEAKVFTDSKLAVCQLNGEWQCKHPGIQALKQKVEEVAAQLERVEYIHIRRNLNSVADGLARKGSEESAAAAAVTQA